jgi:hypothetical protein
MKGKNERFSIMFTNLVVVVIVFIASLTIGLKTYLIIQVPVMLIAGAKYPAGSQFFGGSAFRGIFRQTVDAKITRINSGNQLI